MNEYDALEQAETEMAARIAADKAKVAAELAASEAEFLYEMADAARIVAEQDAKDDESARILAEQ